MRHMVRAEEMIYPFQNGLRVYQKLLIRSIDRKLSYSETKGIDSPHSVPPKGGRGREVIQLASALFHRVAYGGGGRARFVEYRLERWRPRLRAGWRLSAEVAAACSDVRSALSFARYSFLGSHPGGLFAGGAGSFTCFFTTSKAGAGGFTAWAMA